MLWSYCIHHIDKFQIINKPYMDLSMLHSGRTTALPQQPSFACPSLSLFWGASLKLVLWNMWDYMLWGRISGARMLPVVLSFHNVLSSTKKKTLINSDREWQFFNLTAEAWAWLRHSRQRFATGIATVGFIFIWSRQIAVVPPQVCCRCLILRARPGEQHIDKVIQQPWEERAICLSRFACIWVSAY